MIVYVTIGNSDDKLTQHQWSCFWIDTNEAVSLYANVIHGAWASDTTSSYQNACWCAEVTDPQLSLLRADLRGLAERYNQDSIALSVIPDNKVEMLVPARSREE